MQRDSIKNKILENFIKELISLIKKDCKLDKKYEKIIDKTFKFQDNKNSERVYEEIKKL